MKCFECGREFIPIEGEPISDDDDVDPVCPSCADPLFDEELVDDDDYTPEDEQDFDTNEFA